MTWILMWLNWSVTTINVTFQLLDIYRYVDIDYYYYYYYFLYLKL